MEEKKIEKSLLGILISLLKEGKEVWVGTHGKSMLPLIREGDWVKIKPAKLAQFEKGDIVAFYYKNRDEIIVHRLIKKNKHNLITRGDNFFFKYSDPPLKEDNLLGRVVARKKNGKVICLDRGLFNYYGRLIYYLSRYAYPGLFFILCLRELFTLPHLFPQKAIQNLRRLIGP